MRFTLNICVCYQLFLLNCPQVLDLIFKRILVMKIISAEFLTGAVSCKQYPDSVCPELAFVGRSNVGKFSLINSLLNKKSLLKPARLLERLKRSIFLI